MEEKKSGKKVGVNTSSGAKKVQRIEKEKQASAVPASGTVKRTVTKKVEEENAAAGVRLEAAKARAERKARREEKRAERRQETEAQKLQAKERAMEKRLQAKERAQERRAARAARRDMLRNETAVQRMERKEREKQERIALRKQNRELKHELALKRKEERMHKRRLEAENRKHTREQKTKRRAQGQGIGGWLAAVISLGVASLAMLTVITVGGVNMSNMSEMMGASYRSELYEVTELSENLDANLNKLRLASGAGEQRRLLTDILVDAELMESALERFPVDMATTNNIASFVNRTSEFAREGLSAVAMGRSLSGRGDTLEYMYETNAAILQELHTLRDTMTAKDWQKLVKNSGEGMMQGGFENINSNVIQTPSSIQDGPFSENKEKVTARGLLDAEEVTAEKAEELAREYFRDYGVQEAEHTGDTVSDGMHCYNFTLRDERGREIYAQLSKAGGRLIMFDSYEKCMANNFSQAECVQIAAEFLQNLGMDGMHPVWLQENGTAANINFVYEQDGVLCYSDMVIVKVCETKGMAVGMEALPYYLNHCERSIERPAVSEGEAAKALGKIQPATARLALIPYEGSEALTYEFSGSYDGKEYFVYVDAMTGEELEMFTVLDTKQGRLLR